MEEYSMPTLDVVQSPKESKAAVVCIRYSYRGDYLAVSYNNEYRSDDDAHQQHVSMSQAEQNVVESSFVLIYVNRLS
jgi:hypothetical protein